ncbi:MAG: SAM-dependent chlorinase/fluorinase [Chloroflexi bacterium]|nr:SAM-dependent chlorinase/fluorinase [Chloroflexota bacterium]
MARPVVTLLTDFGLEDTYVGAMKGVILSLCPDAQLIDLSHQVPPQDVRKGALLLASAFTFFPAGTVHLAVVDPGVGTERRPIAMQGGGYYFVAPDNGLLTLVLDHLDPEGAASGRAVERSLSPAVRAVHLTESRFWRQPLSGTFHGRDLFGPVAAHLANGVPLEHLGRPVSTLRVLSLPRPQRQHDGSIAGCVLDVDRFGNLTTNIRGDDLPSADIEVEIAGRRISRLSRSYAGGAGLLATINSGGYLEIAVTNGSAAQELGAGRDAPIVVRPRA